MIYIKDNDDKRIAVIVLHSFKKECVACVVYVKQGGK